MTRYTVIPSAIGLWFVWDTKVGELMTKNLPHEKAEKVAAHLNSAQEKLDERVDA